jgi:hypothetical protein
MENQGGPHHVGYDYGHLVTEVRVGVRELLMDGSCNLILRRK